MSYSISDHRPCMSVLWVCISPFARRLVCDSGIVPTYIHLCISSRRANLLLKLWFRKQNGDIGLEIELEGVNYFASKILRNVFFTGGARINPSIIIIALMSRFGEYHGTTETTLRTLANYPKAKYLLRRTSLVSEETSFRFGLLFSSTMMRHKKKEKLRPQTSPWLHNEWWCYTGYSPWSHSQTGGFFFRQLGKQLLSSKPPWDLGKQHLCARNKLETAWTQTNISKGARLDSV
jgi:hypothetical protein